MTGLPDLMTYTRRSLRLEFAMGACHTNGILMKYTVNRGSQEIGKFELADIKALMNAGVILPTDYFWFQGMSDWKQVSSLFAQETTLAPQVVVPPLPAARAENIGQVVMTQQIGPSCPSCYSTDVIKAHAAYEASLQQHSLSAGTSSGFRLWAGGESINKVGVKCAPPVKPETINTASSDLSASIISGFISGTAILLLMSGLMGSTAFLVGLVSIVGIGLSIFLARRWKKLKAKDEETNQKAMRQYKAKMADYVRTWRCNKCGIMYTS